MTEGRTGEEPEAARRGDEAGPAFRAGDDLDAFFERSGPRPGAADEVAAPDGEATGGEMWGRGRRARRERHRSRRRRVAAGLFAFVAVPLVLVVGGGVWVARQLDPPGRPGDGVEVTIERGWGVSAIAGELARRDVIGSALVFQGYAQLTGAGPFQAGTYEMRRDLGVRGAVKALEAGPRIDYLDLRVPPGLRLGEIAQRVEKQLPGSSARRFLDLAASGEVRSRYQPEGVASLEGLLWPDTYRFTKDDDELAVLRTMVEEFDSRLDELGMASKSVRGLTPYQFVVAASLVQSEAKTDGDRPLVASVIFNRLAQGMPLQIDATVLYAIGERKPSNTEADRATDSPYNTYRVTGLPPTPIAGITKASLEAVLTAPDTPFLYYVVSDEEGNHAFAATYEEHLRNVEEARKKGLLK